mmetsp:Transcript_17774/g.45258  ORF Transcript_17774/g.45258 Transcript_17774/m.45258 type:complete len:87 (-) Transcript_17774:132-392(-)
MLISPIWNSCSTQNLPRQLMVLPIWKSDEGKFPHLTMAKPTTWEATQTNNPSFQLHTTTTSTTGLINHKHTHKDKYRHRHTHGQCH